LSSLALLAGCAKTQAVKQVTAAEVTAAAEATECKERKSLPEIIDCENQVYIRMFVAIDDMPPIILLQQRGAVAEAYVRGEISIDEAASKNSDIDKTIRSFYTASVNRYYDLASEKDKRTFRAAGQALQNLGSAMQRQEQMSMNRSVTCHVMGSVVHCF